MKSIELTSTERLWYEKFCAAGIDSNAANELARMKSTIDIFKDLYPNEDLNFEPTGVFYRFCIDKGRLSNKEVEFIFSRMNGTFNNYDYPYEPEPLFGNRHPLKDLWKFVLDLFK